MEKFPKKRAAWIISDQLLRAGTSIGANIVEAQAASSRRDFTNFLNHALKSANETKFWLILSKDLNPKLSPTRSRTSFRQIPSRLADSLEE
ncbi:four helix bundle protein [Patescibacteria group bacterium]|nr:four helix bundle protein [Patescibacteria group bacterium]